MHRSSRASLWGEEILFKNPLISNPWLLRNALEVSEGFLGHPLWKCLHFSLVPPLRACVCQNSPFNVLLYSELNEWANDSFSPVASGKAPLNSHYQLLVLILTSARFLQVTLRQPFHCCGSQHLLSVNWKSELCSGPSLWGSIVRNNKAMPIKCFKYFGERRWPNTKW